MTYVLGLVEYGSTYEGEYCFDILDYMLYIFHGDDTPKERNMAIRVYKELYKTNRTPVVISYAYNNVVFLNMDVVMVMFKPLMYENLYHISFGYYDNTNIRYMNCEIGDILISSDYPGCPIDMVGIPWNVLTCTLNRYPEVDKCIPESLISYLDSIFTKKKQIVE